MRLILTPDGVKLDMGGPADAPKMGLGDLTGRSVPTTLQAGAPLAPPPVRITAENWVNQPVKNHPWRHASGWGVWIGRDDVVVCGLVAAPVTEAEPFRPVWWDPEVEAYNSKGVGIHMVGWEFYREADPEKGLRQVRVL